MSIEKILKKEVNKLHNNSEDLRYWSNMDLFYSLDTLDRYATNPNRNARQYYDRLYKDIKLMYNLSESELRENMKMYHDINQTLNAILLKHDYE